MDHIGIKNPWKLNCHSSWLKKNPKWPLSYTIMFCLTPPPPIVMDNHFLPNPPWLWTITFGLTPTPNPSVHDIICEQPLSSHDVLRYGGTDLFPTSSTNLSKTNNNKKSLHKLWHVICEMCHMTCDTWHIPHAIKIQVPRSNGLKTVFWSLGGKGWLN